MTPQQQSTMYDQYMSKVINKRIPKNSGVTERLAAEYGVSVDTLLRHIRIESRKRVAVLEAYRNVLEMIRQNKTPAQVRQFLEFEVTCLSPK